MSEYNFRLPDWLKWIDKPLLPERKTDFSDLIRGSEVYPGSIPGGQLMGKAGNIAYDLARGETSPALLGATALMFTPGMQPAGAAARASRLAGGGLFARDIISNAPLELAAEDLSRGEFNTPAMRQTALWGGAAAAPFAIGGLLARRARRKARKTTPEQELPEELLKRSEPEQLLTEEVIQQPSATSLRSPTGKIFDPPPEEMNLSGYGQMDPLDIREAPNPLTGKKPEMVTDPRTGAVLKEPFTEPVLVGDKGSFRTARRKRRPSRNVLIHLPDGATMRMKDTGPRRGRTYRAGEQRKGGSRTPNPPEEQLANMPLRTYRGASGDGPLQDYARMRARGEVGAHRTISAIKMKFITDLAKKYPGQDLGDVNDYIIKNMSDFEVENIDIDPPSIIRELRDSYDLNDARLSLDPSEAPDQAWGRFASRYKKSVEDSNIPLKNQAKDEWNKYARATGLDQNPNFQRFRRDLNLPSEKNELIGLNQATKSLILAAGLPRTGLNIHGFSIAMRALTDKQGSFFRTFGRLIKPGKISPDQRQLIESARRAGVNMSTEWTMKGGKVGRPSGLSDVFGDNFLTRQFDKQILDRQERWFGEPLFNRIIPKVKAESWRGYVRTFRKQGMDLKQAEWEAAKITNSLYGGIDQKALIWKGNDGQYHTRSKRLNNALRILVLAPDWMETNRKLFLANIPDWMAKSLSKAWGKKGLNLGSEHERRVLKKMRGKIIALYASGDAVQFSMTGQHIWENEPGKRWDIKTGMKDSHGKDIYVPLGLGTSTDYARLPVELLGNVAEGDIPEFPDIARGRLSQPAKTAINLLKGTDFANRPLHGQDRFGRDIPTGEAALNISRELVDLFLPQYPEAASNLLSGTYSPEQAAAQALELPLRFHRPYNPDTRRRSR